MGGTSIKILGTEKLIRKCEKKKITPVEARSAVGKGALIVVAEVKESIAGRSLEPRSVDTGNFLNKTKSKVLL